MGPGSWIPDEGTQVVGPESRVPRIGPGPRVPSPGSHFSGMLFFNSEYCKIFKSTFFAKHFRTAASENVFVKFQKCR